jgi:hypothetical protein
MISEKQEIEFVAKLIQLTQAGKLEWRRGERRGSLLSDPDNRIFEVYECLVDGQWLRLYSVTSKYWHDEDRFSWTEDVVLEFIDMDGVATWEVRRVPGLGDLYRSVRFSAGKIGEQIKKIMSLKVE